MTDYSTYKKQLNKLGTKKIPFLFIIDFETENFYVTPFTQLEPNILFSIDKLTNINHIHQTHQPTIKKTPVSIERYKLAFEHVIQEMKIGNTYMLNLTFPTLIETNISLLEIFLSSKAPFKLYFQDKFITFSPERFIKIEDNLIKTYPMKGTINALVPNAKETLLANEKEQAEHNMVVDLLRNDLSIVAKQVQVDKLRYVDQISAGSKTLLQVSSKISGILENNWQQRIGDILLPLLPAGSISGTPKKKTLEIIKTVESCQRGFFTGIFGYFDGNKLDSAVMIRFIEKMNGQLIYKSGGGITIDSDLKTEYNEMLDKVYIPY
ncbi:aminodeoxychorismate synthase component I [Candidatus Halobeggiatoa sp. HSG11]|nr:aminodeoxychorismate synthase component I [Candidatus Halobeggiatoa sp. HSG11]